MRLNRTSRRIRLHRVLVAATCAVVASMLLAPVAARAATSPYGHMRITYRNASTYKWQVTEAFAVWGRAGTPYTFVPARPGTRADITVTQRPYLGSPNSAVAGYGGHGYVQLSVARLKSPRGFHNGQVKIVAHEIGHALGLGHSANRCALMYSSVDYPTRPKCATVEQEWDARQHCGPRGVDISIMARRHRFTPRAVAWRGYCTTPTDPAKAATGPYVAGTLTGATTQFLANGGVELALTNNGNTLHEIGSYGIVMVDASGAVRKDPWSFGQWYYAVSPPPAPGQSIAILLPPCQAELPAIMRLRLASQHHDALLGPELSIRLDSPEGDPAAAPNECAIA